MKILLDKPSPTQFNTSSSANASDSASTFMMDFFAANVDVDAGNPTKIEENDSPAEDATLAAMEMSLLILQQQLTKDPKEAVEGEVNDAELNGRHAAGLPAENGLPEGSVSAEVGSQTVMFSKQLAELTQEAQADSTFKQQPDDQLKSDQLKPDQLKIDQPASASTLGMATTEKLTKRIASSPEASKSDDLQKLSAYTRNDQNLSEVSVMQTQEVKVDVKTSDMPTAALSVDRSGPINQQVKIDKIELLQGQGVAGSHQVHIKVTPVELGPVVTHLRIDKNKAELEVVTKNIHVSDIIKAHLPELRAQFSQSNLQLTTISVREDANFFANNNKDDERLRDQTVREELFNVNVPIKQEDKKKSADSLVDAYI